MNQAEKYGYEKQGGGGGKQQAANYGAPQRRILLSALTQPDRHRDHSNDHGQRRHQYWTKARSTQER